MRGILIWLYSIITFAFLYWELDGGGPEERALNPPAFPDLAFPEQLNPSMWLAPTWAPAEFFDYLYLGFTNATAFSPTDVMPLPRGVKLAMAVQAAGSLFILGLVIARAINILEVAARQPDLSSRSLSWSARRGGRVRKPRSAGGP